MRGIFTDIRAYFVSHFILQEHIRQSKESKLDEAGRSSMKRSLENVNRIAPRYVHVNSMAYANVRFINFRIVLSNCVHALHIYMHNAHSQPIYRSTGYPAEAKTIQIHDDDVGQMFHEMEMDAASISHSLSRAKRPQYSYREQVCVHIVMLLCRRLGSEFVCMRTVRPLDPTTLYIYIFNWTN